jgi:hypothetical protein
VLAVSIDCGKILVPARSIDFGEPQDCCGQIRGAENGPFSEDLFVPILKCFMRRSLGAIRGNKAVRSGESSDNNPSSGGPGSIPINLNSEIRFDRQAF